MTYELCTRCWYSYYVYHLIIIIILLYIGLSTTQFLYSIYVTLLYTERYILNKYTHLSHLTFHINKIYWCTSSMVKSSLSSGYTLLSYVYISLFFFVFVIIYKGYLLTYIHICWYKVIIPWMFGIGMQNLYSYA